MATTAMVPRHATAMEARVTGMIDRADSSLWLRDANPGMRVRALQDLARQGENGAIHGNHEKAFYLLDDAVPAVQAAALAALGAMGKYGATYSDYMAQMISPKRPKEVRMAAVRALGSLGQYASAQAGQLELYLEDEDLDLVGVVCSALGAVGSQSVAPKLIKKLESPDVEVAVGACRGLGLLGAGATELLSMAKRKEARVRSAAAAALSKNSTALSTANYKEVVDMLSDSDMQVRINAVSLITALASSASPDASFVTTVGGLLKHQEPGVRAAAASALGALGASATTTSSSEIPQLEKLLTDKDEDSSTRVLTVAGIQPKTPPTYRKPACAAAAALATFGPAAARSASKLADALDSFDEEVRVQCTCALAGLGEAGAKYEDRIVALLEDPSPLVVAAACYSLGALAEATKTSSTTIAAQVADCIKDKHPAIRGTAVGSLGKMGEEAVARLEDITQCFNDKVGYVRAQACQAICGCGEIGQMYAGEVARLLFDEDERVKLAAVTAIPKLGQRGAAFAEETAALLEDASAEVRVAAVKAIGNMQGFEAKALLPIIQRVAEEDEQDQVRSAAEAAAASMRALEDAAE